MKTKFIFNLLVFIVLAVLILGISSYHRNRKQKSSKKAAITNLKTDSADKNSIWELSHDLLPRKIYVVVNALNLYKNFSLDGDILAILRLGDSVELINKEGYENISYDYFQTDSTYKIQFIKDGHELQGYVNGKNIGFGNKTDIDNDGRFEILVAHYTKYAPVDNLSTGKAELVLIKDSNIVASMPFEGYNSIYLSAFGTKKLLQGIQLYVLQYGLEACDYPNGEILFYYHDKKLDSISNKEVEGNEQGGYHEEYYFPGDPQGNSNALTVKEHIGRNEDHFDSITNVSIYPFRNGKFSRAIRK